MYFKSVVTLKMSIFAEETQMLYSFLLSNGNAEMHLIRKEIIPVTMKDSLAFMSGP